MFSESDQMELIAPWLLNMKRPRMCREFLFRRDKSETGETYLSESDIRWFTNELIKKRQQKFHEVIKPKLEMLVKKYILEEHYSTRIYFAFNQAGGIVHHTYLKGLIPYDLRDELLKDYDPSKVTNRKIRIEYDEFNTPICEFLEEEERKYHDDNNLLQHLFGKLERELLTREELFKIFPDAEKLFAQRNEEKETKKEDDNPLTYKLVDELLKD